MNALKTITLLTLALALLLAGCAAPAATPSNAAFASPSNAFATSSNAFASPSNAFASSSNALASPSNALATPSNATAVLAPATGAADNTMEAKLAAMMPVLDSLVRAMGHTGDIAYRADDPSFVWNVLYLAGENWGGTHPLVTKEGETLVVPAAVMREYAEAAFGSALSALPEIPADLAQSLGYDAAADVYRLAPSDSGATDVTLARYIRTADGGITVTMQLSVADETLGYVHYILTKNANRSGAAAPRFPYSVTGPAPASDKAAFWQSYELGRTIETDLDCDGTPERVTVSVAGEDGLTVTAEWNGKTYSDRFDYYYNPSFHLGDALDSDGASELYVTGDTGSDDYETTIYRLTPEGFTKETLFGNVLYADGSGLLPIETAVNVLGTYSGVCFYRFDATGAVTPGAEYAVAQGADGWAWRALTVKKDGLPASDVDRGGDLSFPVGTKLLLLATDAQSYALCECEDGRLVRIPIAQKADEWEWRIAGEPESEWFTELLYAG